MTSVLLKKVFHTCLLLKDPNINSSHCSCFLQCFPLGGDDEVMSSTLQQFAKVIDEVTKDAKTENN